MANKLTMLMTVLMLSAVSHAEIAPKRIDNKTFNYLLAFGELDPLTASLKGPDGETLKLYRAPHGGECMPGDAWVCSYTYYLSVASSWEAAESVLYELGTVGEIVGAKRSNGEGHLILNFSVLELPAGVLKEKKRPIKPSQELTLKVEWETVEVVKKK